MGIKFNEKIRQRIFGSSLTYSSSSSGSDHDGESDAVSPSSSSSFCLSHLVQNFLEDDDFDSATSREFESDSDSFLLDSDPTPTIVDFINPIVRNNADLFRSKLLVTVSKGVEIFSVFQNNRSVFNRNLMSYLRENGYNAGVCKTRRNSASGGITAGNYEFVDVLWQDSRYVVDTEFSGEFEIARETERYSILRSSLPRFFVGKSDDLKKIIRLMCDESKRSMKINGLILPPWRKNKYMVAKWLGSYRRTTHHSSAAGVLSSVVGGFAVKCRSVGFELTGDGCRIVALPTS